MMLTSAASVVGSAAAGSAIKIVAGLLQNWADAAVERRRAAHDIRMAELGKEFKGYEIQVSNSHLNVTRRRLAYGLCLTLCLIAVYCTAFPDIVFFTIPVTPGQPATYSILFGFFEWRGTTPRVDTLVVTTGTMAYHFVYAATMYLGFYFTPIGKK